MDACTLARMGDTCVISRVGMVDRLEDSWRDERGESILLHPEDFRSYSYTDSDMLAHRRKASLAMGYSRKVQGTPPPDERN